MPSEHQTTPVTPQPTPMQPSMPQSHHPQQQFPFVPAYGPVFSQQMPHQSGRCAFCEQQFIPQSYFAQPSYVAPYWQMPRR